MYMYVRIAVEEEPCKESRGADLSAHAMLGGTFLTIVELDDGKPYLHSILKFCLDLGR